MKKVLLTVSLAAIFMSCVPQKKYNELEQKYYAALQENTDLKNAKSQLDKLQETYDKLVSDKAEQDKNFAELTDEYKEAKSKLENLQQQYNQLQSSKEELAKTSANKNRQILNELEDAQSSLNDKDSKLRETQEQLQNKIDRINQLEGLIAQQKQILSDLKSSISEALKGYEGKGITVHERDGNIYVSMENKLLFASGKWAVEPAGLKALQDLSAVLKQQTELKIVVEGHTDTDKFFGGQQIKDNWDLSVMRATSITKVLQGEGVSPTQITASGRGEYFPIADNSTNEGKAKNRRVEIILAPNLDKINKLLNEL